MKSHAILSSGVSLDEIVDLSSVPHHRHFTHHPFIDRLRKAVPFDYVAAAGLDLDNYRFGSGRSLDTDLPPAFADTYYGDDLIKVDPFVQASLTARDVILEADVYRASPPPLRLAYVTRTFGIHNRTLFPLLRGPVVYGAMTFCRTTPFTHDEIDFFADVAPSAHAALTKPITEKFSASTLKLSSGEIHCLRLGSLGMTSEQISAESGYTTDTVNTYIKTAIRKLGASNRVHAIAEALRRNIIV